MWNVFKSAAVCKEGASTSQGRLRKTKTGAITQTYEQRK